jgi:hypothetical protein
VTARLCCERYGQDNVTLLFADTLIEDEDLYRFLADVEQDTQLPIVRISDGRDPWQVFSDVSFIGNSRVDPCSLNLKRLLLKRWIVEHCDPATTVVAIGIDWTEIDRCERITAGQLPFTAVYPLIDAGLDKDQCFQVAAERGIKPPRLYDLGFPHNNCGGFCVKAGISQFVRLYRTMPDRYRWHEQREQDLREQLGVDVAILRDRRGGQTKPMTMQRLRERIEAGEKLPGDEWGGCGCALDDSESALAVSIRTLCPTERHADGI